MELTIVNILLVALGGAIGAVLRFTVGQIVDSSQFPWATFIVNFVGAFLLALLTFSCTGFSLEVKLLLFTGLFGAFTTMSTFSLETVKLFFDDEFVKAGLNVVLNVALCLGGAAIGRYIGLLIA